MRITGKRESTIYDSGAENLVIEWYRARYDYDYTSSSLQSVVH